MENVNAWDTREASLESALIRLLVGIGEPVPDGFTCDPYEGLKEDAISEAYEAINYKRG